MNFQKIDYYASYGTSSQLPESSAGEIVFSGKSNVGKSSLMNKLFNRKNLVRVSSMPGKTITVNFYKGDGVYFVDLPGYGYAKRNFDERKRWAELMEGYFKQNRNISLVFQLLDIRHSPTDDDYTMLNFLSKTKIPFVIVLTKADKLNKSELFERREQLKSELSKYENVKKIEFSAITGIGIEQIRESIECLN